MKFYLSKTCAKIITNHFYENMFLFLIEKKYMVTTLKCLKLQPIKKFDVIKIFDEIEYLITCRHKYFYLKYFL